VRVERGATSTIELELLRGADLAGRVVDANGAPLAGVQLMALSSSENQFNEHQVNQRSVMSAADGSFRIRAVSPPTVQLKGSHAVSVRLDVDGLWEGISTLRRARRSKANLRGDGRERLGQGRD
jgi:hypothetical protein